jgi:hypothetical protein
MTLSRHAHTFNMGTLLCINLTLAPALPPVKRIINIARL